MGRALNELVTIVHPGTLRLWTREERKRHTPAGKSRHRRTAEQIHRPIVTIAK